MFGELGKVGVDDTRGMGFPQGIGAVLRPRKTSLDFCSGMERLGS